MNILKIKTAIAILLFCTGALAQNPYGKQFELDQIIQGEIKKDGAFENLDVSARMLDGYVTLEGYVDNIWQRDRLIEISQNVHGVVGVIDRLEIVGISIDSENLAKDVALKLYRDDVADVYEVKVVTDNYGRAKLDGKVDSLQEKKAADAAMKKVKGVTFTQNNLKIEENKNRTDSEVQKDLEFALYDNILIDERRLEPKVRSSVATIEGNVGNEQETLIVEKLAKEVAGVDEVRVTEVTIVPSFDRTIVFKLTPVEKDYSDAALARMVDQANYYDTRVFSYNIDVDARNGVVELSGTAKDVRARDAAVENARNTIGVKDVINNIAVDDFSPDQELLSE